MTRAKMIYLSPEAHGRLKVIAARYGRPMGRVVEDWVERESAELSNPWTGPGGLLLQQKALASVWDDPALDVYAHD